MEKIKQHIPDNYASLKKHEGHAVMNNINLALDKDFEEFLIEKEFVQTHMAYHKNGSLTPQFLACLNQKDIAVQCTALCKAKCKFCCWFGTSLDNLHDRSMLPEIVRVGNRRKEDIHFGQLEFYFNTINYKMNNDNCYNMVYLEPFDDFNRTLPALTALSNTKSKILMYTNAISLTDEMMQKMIDKKIYIDELRINIGPLREYSEKKEILFQRWVNNIKKLKTIAGVTFLESPAIPDTLEWVKNKNKIITNIFDGFMISELHLRGESNIKNWIVTEPLIQYFGAQIIPLRSKIYMKELINLVDHDNKKIVIQDSRIKLVRDVSERGVICKDVYNNFDRKEFLNLCEYIKGSDS